MPKPFSDQTGTGTHVHVSLHDLEGKNLFVAKEENDNLGLSDVAYKFMAGILDNADAACSIYCPTVNR
jgi:glutamine synthetase